MKDRVVYIADVADRERKAIDWNRVHMEADKRGPIFISPNLWRWSTPSRKCQCKEGANG